MTYKNSNRRDKNETEIIAFWRSVGCLWIQMPPSAGFDGLLIDGPVMHIVEIKNPAGRMVLTDREQTLKNQIEIRGGNYNIIRTLDEAGRLHW